MKKKSFWLITVLMTVALLGVFVMQLYYIRESYKLKSQLFDEQVNQTLTSVVNKLQRRNVADHLNRKDAENKLKQLQDSRQRALDIKDLRQQYVQEAELRQAERENQIESYLNQQDSIIRVSYRAPNVISEREYTSLSSKNGDKLDLQMDAIIDIKSLILKGYSMRSKPFTAPPKAFEFKSMQSLPDTLRYLVFDPRDGTPGFANVPKIPNDLQKKFQREDEIERKKLELKIAALGKDTFSYTRSSVVEDVSKELQETNVPIYKRINFNSLGVLLKQELLANNITLEPSYRISLARKDSTIYMTASNVKGEFLPENTYKTPLFGNDIFRDPGMLFVSFPNKNSAIISNLSATLASSIGLLLVLVFIFSYTLYAILKQKKLSEMKTDFINNMTHEFKTPVATIMIASEALKDPEVTADKARLKRLAGIIYDENVRLGNHIERVLSIARLEKGELKMENTEVDVNDLIVIVLDSMELQLQKRNAVINVHTDAEHAIVYGDELHLSNVIYNLIDNANKYSSDTPEITITTRNTGKNLIIEIADKGIGMTKEQSKRIFDQFYRVPTGNLHDVKGFGLGLNYVQDIIKKLNGTVKVSSEKDRGTTFEISLPL
ncbi:HAMP domain-containing histidine kinase [Pedobacter sp. ISL-68]|uniref:sensor histidine kinase n=1 Tax=unclassified Pedobacter TaxID=2628915 RepID=UPI001BE934F3|nr:MULTISPECIES: HAMP domain-containing sensor histidine kinase [unclassified Pedobacter]MBT2563307.1 HAMP domain-containing histidine kinase [Pedobacter sp. ISL-64]MBT2588652.1 HAMP domain-containing histidine kinase [Pedobacter sp. ISL-68]